MMAGAETERDIGRLEGRVDAIEGWMQSIDGKVDKILAALNMGRGAGWALFKIGSVIVLILMAGAWLWDHAAKIIR